MEMTLSAGHPSKTTINAIKNSALGVATPSCRIDAICSCADSGESSVLRINELAPGAVRQRFAICK